MKRALILAGALALCACSGPKSKGENCIYSHPAGTCTAMCRNTYAPDTEKVLACQEGVREETARKKKVDKAFGRDE